MFTIAGIIYIVIFSTFVRNINAASSSLITQNATSGKPAVLKCIPPFRAEDVETVVYWKHNTKLICYTKFSKKKECEDLQHSTDAGEMTLTIPELNSSHAGRYTCNIFIKNDTHECNIELKVQEPIRRMVGSNGIYTKAGPVLLLLPLAVVIWSFPFISL